MHKSNERLPHPMRTAQRDSVCSHTCWQNAHIKLLNWFSLISPSGRSFTHSSSVKENMYRHRKWHQYVVPAIFYSLTIGQSEFKHYSDAMMDGSDLNKDEFPKVKEKSKFPLVSLNLSVLSRVSSLIGHFKAGHFVFSSPVSRCVPPPL